MVRELCTGIGNGIFVRRMEWNGPRHLGMPRRTLVGWLTSRSFPVPQEDGAVAPVRFRGPWSLFRESTGREYGHRWSPVAPWSRVADTNPSGASFAVYGTGRDGSSLTCSDPNHPVTPLPLLSFVRFSGCQPNPTFSSDTSRDESMYV